MIWRAGGRRPWERRLRRLGAPLVAASRRCGGERYFRAPAAGTPWGPAWGHYAPLVALLAAPSRGAVWRIVTFQLPPIVGTPWAMAPVLSFFAP